MPCLADIQLSTLHIIQLVKQLTGCTANRKTGLRNSWLKGHLPELWIIRRAQIQIQMSEDFTPSLEIMCAVRNQLPIEKLTWSTWST